MVFVRWPRLKTGHNVNPTTMINPVALTPSQKMLMTRNRIWGNKVGEGYRSGYKELKQEWDGAESARYYEHARLKMVYPFVDDWGKQNRLKIKYEEKKQRIFMRGVKIGTKRTQSTKGMGIFEMSKKAESPAAQA